MTRARPAVPLLGVLLLTACDPGAPAPTGSPSEPAPAPTSATPTPEPETRPDRADLAISPEGMGTLVLGVAPPTDPALAMIELDAEWCTDANTGYGIGVGPGDPEAALWVPIADYRDGRDADFGVHVDVGVLSRIDIFGSAIPTTEGVRVGDSRAELEAAYPEATIVEEYLTDIYVVTGAAGSLQLAVSKQPEDMVYWLPDEVERVTYVHAVRTGIGPFTVAASENIAGLCPF